MKLVKKQCRTCGTDIYLTPTEVKRGVVNCSKCKCAHFRRNYGSIDETQYNKYLNKHTKLIHFICRELANEYGVDYYDDIKSMCMIELYKVIARGNEVKNIDTAFHTALNHVKYAFIKGRLKEDKIVDRTIDYHSTNMVLVDKLGPKVTPSDNILLCKELILSNCSNIHFQYMLKQYEGYSLAEIASMYNDNRTPNNISRHLTKLRKDLKDGL